MKHIKLQSRIHYECLAKALDLELDPCGGLTGLSRVKCRKENAMDS